jgi:hypothetical protein
VAEVLKWWVSVKVSHGKGGTGQMVGDRLVRQAVGRNVIILSQRTIKGIVIRPKRVKVLS